MDFLFLVCFACLLVSASLLTLGRAQSRRPNIVYILTDDQDITLGGMQIMTQTKKLIVDQGMTFNNAFVSSPICCISRSSFLSGRYVHNNHCTGNGLSTNCSSIWWQTNIEPYCYAPVIQASGYLTFYAGKYLNQYGNGNAGGVEHIPDGWTFWYGLVGNSKYYEYSISNNGVKQTFGTDYNTDYYTDVIHAHAIEFLDSYHRNYSQNNDAPPFLMQMATPAAHAPFTPAPQYSQTYSDMVAPRVPNWNNVEVSAGKHDLMQEIPAMNATIIAQSDQIFRDRAGTLLSVDDIIADVYQTLDNYGLLENTYFLYTSDHGFHSGQFGMGFDKRQLYENDIRIPFYMSGPGIPMGSSTDMIVVNIDVAPTLIDICVGSQNIPSYMDGRSFKPFVMIDSRSTASDIEQQFLIEYFGAGSSSQKVVECGNGIPGYTQQPCDSQNNTYRCLRMINGTDGQINGSIFCTFLCYYNDVLVECPADTPQGYGEFYDIDADFYELKNLMLSLSVEERQRYQSMMDSFMSCAGQTECNALRNGNIIKKRFL